MIFFLSGYNKIDKQNLVRMTSLYHDVKRCGGFDTHKFLYLNDNIFIYKCADSET